MALCYTARRIPGVFLSGMMRCGWVSRRGVVAARVVVACGGGSKIGSEAILRTTASNRPKVQIWFVLRFRAAATWHEPPWLLRKGSCVTVERKTEYNGGVALGKLRGWKRQPPPLSGSRSSPEAQVGDAIWFSEREAATNSGESFRVTVAGYWEKLRWGKLRRGVFLGEVGSLSSVLVAGTTQLRSPSHGRR